VALGGGDWERMQQGHLCQNGAEGTCLTLTRVRCASDGCESIEEHCDHVESMNTTRRTDDGSIESTGIASSEGYSRTVPPPPLSLPLLMPPPPLPLAPLPLPPPPLPLPQPMPPPRPPPPLSPLPSSLMLGTRGVSRSGMSLGKVWMVT
jgi:hypothetical protein